MKIIISRYIILHEKSVIAYLFFYLNLQLNGYAEVKTVLSLDNSLASFPTSVPPFLYI